MENEQIARWQGHGRAQLSVVIALLASLSTAAIGIELSLVQSDRVVVGYSLVSSLVLFTSTILTAIATEITRLLDFKLTARVVMKRRHPEYDKSLKILWQDADSYGASTWRLLAASCVCFPLGVILLTFALACSIRHM